MNGWNRGRLYGGSRRASTGEFPDVAFHDFESWGEDARIGIRFCQSAFEADPGSSALSGPATFVTQKDILIPDIQTGGPR